MWQMYVGIVGVNCDAWVQFTTECNLSLDKVKDPLKFLYLFQCLSEGRSDVYPVSSVFKDNIIEFPSKVLLPYHIALLYLFLSKSTEQWKYYIFCGNVMDDVGVKILSNFLLANKKLLTCIGILNLSSNCLTSQSATTISNII